MPLWAALPRHETVVYIIFQCMNTTRKDVCSIYLIYVAYIYIYVYICFCVPFLFQSIRSSIDISLLQFTHRSISFDPVMIGLLLPFFHGGISCSIVAKKEDN